MTTTIRLSRPADRAVLSYLRDLAAGNGGYELDSVRGWASEGDVVQRVTCPTAGVLPRLHERGLVSRVDARIPGMIEATWVYRISELGATLTEKTSPSEQAPLAPRLVRPSVPAVHLPYEHLVVLLVLRACWDDHEIGTRFGGNGWALPHELETRLNAFNARCGPPLAPTDPMPSLEWLEARELVLWDYAFVPEGQDPGPIFWRPTPRGVRMTLLFWRDPGNPESDARWEPYRCYYDPPRWFARTGYMAPG